MVVAAVGWLWKGGPNPGVGAAGPAEPRGHHAAVPGHQQDAAAAAVCLGGHQGWHHLHHRKDITQHTQNATCSQ